MLVAFRSIVSDASAGAGKAAAVVATSGATIGRRNKVPLLDGVPDGIGTAEAAVLPRTSEGGPVRAPFASARCRAGYVAVRTLTSRSRPLTYHAPRKARASTK